MKPFLSHRSAAEYYRVPMLDAVLDEALDAVDSTFQGHGYRYEAIDARNHSTALPLPPGAIVAITMDRSADGAVPGNSTTPKRITAVASPELVFLQMAEKLNMQRLILLGLQMCAHPPGHPNKSVTSKTMIATFLGKMEGHRGYGKALRAVRYLEDSSNSIMESLAFMVLALPHALGGYGLDGAAFNAEIPLDRRARKLLNQRRCFVDLYYPEAKVAVEYQSYANHAKPGEQSKDMVRAGALERLGISVMQIGPVQLYDAEACRDFAHNLAARLGRRIQIRTEQFAPMHEALRGLFPAKPQGEGQEGSCAKN